MSNTTFAALGCQENILAALDRRGFTTPTPVQAECFKPGLEGRDLLVQSRTGSGKTLAFGLPMLHRLTDERHAQAIILAPTRELAQQVSVELASVQPRLSTALLVGGLSYPPQLKALHYGAQVIVGTPGRVMDHLERKSLDLSKVSMVVLDECDEMLNMGFLEDVEKILSNAPSTRQTFLFSATLPGPIAALANRFLKDPVRIELTGAGGAAQHADIAHTPCLIAEQFHTQALVNFLLRDEPESSLIFTKRKQEAEDVAEALREAGLSAEHLHGDLAQNTRNRILSSFKEGKLRYLVATDVAARGIDVEGMPLVIHMGIPTQLESYIHRSGRTGRAGSKGCSLALVSFKESRILLAWARRADLKLDWRSVPSQQEIGAARVKRLQEKLATMEAPSHLELAKQMLAEREPEMLVAALVSMVEGENHQGYFIPDAPRKDKTDRPKARFSESFKPRQDARFGNRDGAPGREEGSEPKWQPSGKPFREKKEYSENRPAKPFSRPSFENKGPQKTDDRPFAGRKPFNKDSKPAFAKPATGKPFQKRDAVKKK